MQTRATLAHRRAPAGRDRPGPAASQNRLREPRGPSSLADRGLARRRGAAQLEAGADVNAASVNGNTPLHAAAQRGTPPPPFPPHQQAVRVLRCRAGRGGPGRGGARQSRNPETRHGPAAAWAGSRMGRQLWSRRGLPGWRGAGRVEPVYAVRTPNRRCKGSRGHVAGHLEPSLNRLLTPAPVRYLPPGPPCKGRVPRQARSTCSAGSWRPPAPTSRPATGESGPTPAHPVC